jgi:hypothetical protein
MSSATPKLGEQTQPFSIVPGAPSPELQQLWFATQTRPWTSLAVLPASAGGPAFEVAQALYDVGSLASGVPLKLVDGRTVSLSTTASLIVNIMGLQQPSAGRPGGRVLVVLQSLLAEPAGIPVALAADAVLVCIELDKTTLEEAQRTVRLVGGTDKVIGCIDVRPRKA